MHAQPYITNTDWLIRTLSSRHSCVLHSILQIQTNAIIKMWLIPTRHVSVRAQLKIPFVCLSKTSLTFF